jgi:hypothetical protein
MAARITLIAPAKDAHVHIAVTVSVAPYIRVVTA